MGAYAYLYFDSHKMLTVKNGVPLDLLSIFTDDDRLELTTEEFRRAVPFVEVDDDAEGEEVNRYYIYKIPASHAKDRLDLMGINLKKLEILFEKGIEEHKNFQSELKDSSNDDAKQMRNRYNTDNGIKDDIDAYTFEYWKGLVKRAVEYSVSLDDRSFGRFNFLNSETFNWYSDQYGFPSFDLDFRYLLRVLLEYLPATHQIILDYTDLVLSDYEDADAQLCKNAIDFSAHDYSINEKVILLTEGTSDITYLGKSLKLLYPHVSSNFSFADFSAVKYQGGVASVIASLKILISMSIKNRVIAIFDSDSAASDAMRSLKDIILPENIKFLHLPHIDFAKNYPSVGPTGNSNLDINGLACSTELYLPKEILRDQNGHYFPIHWTGYISSIGRYQGEISNKREIMMRFLDAVNAIEKGEARLEDYSWENMHSIFKAIFAELAS